ncbi:MAG: GNAT family N-acetyltransferase [Candidatus Lokiarchaeota archaeon]|nr:GNAT family N-acetyltransferase [Candidatus Lokiarchaeota archaeon]
MVERDANFIQMRLYVKSITPEFEKSLKEKIEHNIFQTNVRKASEEDIDSLIHLHDLAWHSTPMPYRPLKKESIMNLLNDSSFVFLIAKVKEEDSGFALIYFTDEERCIGIIAGMGIIPELQRKGLGTFLGLAAWDYFKKNGVAELCCKVYKENKISYNFIKGLHFEEYDDDFVQWKFF